MKTCESSRKRVWASIILMVIVYVAAVYKVYQAFAASASGVRLVPLAAAVAIVPCVLLTALGIFSMLAKSVRYRSRIWSARITPEIREALANVIIGQGDRGYLRRLARKHRRAFEVVFAEFSSSFEGEVKSELCTLAAEFGLVERWRRAARSRNLLSQKEALANLGRIGAEIDNVLLRHPVEQTRIEAARALLASGSPDAAARVFEMLPEQSPLARILLADSLRPFAEELCERHLIGGMHSNDARRVRTSIDLLRAWERWIPIEGFSNVIAGRDMDLRIAALPALRYASATEQDASQEILSLLGVQDEAVQAAAAKAAADFSISASIPLLINQVRTSGRSAALAAASALARMGPRARDFLESEIFSSPRPEYALQALEQSLVAGIG